MNFIGIFILENGFTEKVFKIKNNLNNKIINIFVGIILIYINVD